MAEQGKLPQAIEQYLFVLQEKPLIEEAKWELCKVLIKSGDLARASFFIESLLELDPDREEYLISAGQLAMQAGNADKAIQYFGQVLSRDPLSEEGDLALEGLVDALLNQGKNVEALPLMEQLVARGYSTQKLLTSIARTTEQEGKPERADFYYSELLRKYRVSDKLLEHVALFKEKQGKFDQAAPIWERFLAENQENIRAHEHLARYYRDDKQFEKAVQHLSFLVDHGIDKKHNLLSLARACLYHLGRADRALAYYEQYRREFPDGEDVSSEIADIQMILANDLLTIVENNGAWMLWRDLVRITPDRLGIYRAMADLLESLGKNKELIEVLQIIVEHDPNNAAVRERLAERYLQSGQFEQCLELTNELEDVKSSATLLKTRSRCQEAVGADIERLASLKAYLRIHPDDAEMNAQAIRLAGEIGILDDVEQLFRSARKNGIVEVATTLAYIDSLATNQLYDTATSKVAKAGLNGENAVHGLLAVPASMISYGSDRGFRTEQVLRTVLANFADSLDALLMLAENALGKNDYASAQIWLAETERTLASAQGQASAEQRQLLKVLRFMCDWGTQDSRDIKRAFQILDNQPDGLENQVSDAQITLMLFLLKKLDRSALRGETGGQLADAAKRLDKDVRAATIARIVMKKRTRSAEQRKTGFSLARPRPSIAKSFEEVGVLVQSGQYPEALELLNQILSRVPESVRAKVLKVQVQLDQHAYTDARAGLLELRSRFPHERFYDELLIDSWNLGDVAKHEKQSNGRQDMSAMGTAADTEHPDTMEEALGRARELWNKNRWNDAIAQYGILFDELDGKISALMTQLEHTAVFKKQFPQWFSKPLLLTPSEEDILDEIMAPGFFVRNRDSELGKLSAPHYAVYRWWKVVKKEREAKIALNEREFYQAERIYRELSDIDTEAVDSSLPDLATIYSRLGKKQQESALFEKLKDSQRDIPELRDASEKNIRQRQPHLNMDMTFQEARGRDDHIDITKKYAGVNVQFIPSVFHETGAWFGRNEYGNSDVSTLLKSVFINGRYAIQFSDSLEAAAQLGFEDFDTDGKSFLVYDVSVKGTLEQKLALDLSFSQNPLTDTIQALADGLYKRKFRLGTTLDLLPRVFVGFDVNVYGINDSNDGREFNVFTSYRIFREQSSYDLSYHYQKIENDIDSDFISDEQSPEDILSSMPYWSPGKYWKHMLTGEYRLELWPTGRLQGGTSYLSALYGIGIEKGDELTQRLALNISLEISPVFLVKGSFSSDWSADYDQYGVSASLAYRW